MSLAHASSRMLRSFVGVLLVIGFATTNGSGRGFQTPGAGAFAAVGPQPTRGYFSQLPFEQVDTVTGNLTLSFTDLVLPGNAGMDLRITRTYSHQGSDSKWSFGFAAVPVAVRVAGTGSPSLLMSDGSSQSLHDNVVSGYLVTTGFWRYATSTRLLYLPNGTIATYSAQGQYSEYCFLHHVTDVYGNTITPTWDSSSRVSSVTQTVDDAGTTRTRTVTFSYSGTTQPSSMSDGERTWTYTYESGSPWRLTRAQPPVGADWEFAYGSNAVTVTTPTGGTVAYAFQDEDGRSAVHTVTTGGRAITAGTWTVDYAPSGTTATTTVTTPSDRDLVYVHAWHDGPDGKLWTLTERSVFEGSTEVFSLARTYTDIGFLTDKPLKVVNVQTIVQDGVTFTTDYDYSSSTFGDYLQPNSTTASASNHGTTLATARTFDTFSGGYILPRVAEETVTMGSESHTRSLDYDATGFVVAQTALGVTTTFTRDSFGNLASVTDAHSHTTSTSSQWGVPATVTTPEYTISRSINSDGSIASETRNGQTTSYSYDDLGRVTLANPADGDDVETTYASDGSSVTVTRGSSWVTTTVDGFGRPIGTETVGGVKTTTTIDAEGRTTFQSAPFTGSSGTGNTFAFDALGRITIVTHADASDVTYSYSGTSVTITDENNHTTTQT